MTGSRTAACLGALFVLSGCTAPDTPGVVTMLDTPALAGAGQAHLAGGADAPLVLSWQEPASGGVTRLRTSQFDGAGWTESRNVAEGENWFVNWADFPSVVPFGPTMLVAHWLALKPDQRYAYDIAYSLSHDSGRSWSAPRVLNTDTEIAEHGFVSFFAWGGDIGAVWLDGRAIAALSIDELFELEEPVGMTLRFARFDRSGNVVERGEIDDLVCDCCQTDAVTTDDGPLIVYRDRTTDEIRDISIRRAEFVSGVAGAAATARWTEPVVLGPDSWRIDGCPVNGPALSAAGDHIGVAWFTAADNRPRLRFARSRNAGRDFETAITVASENALGQVDVVMTTDGTAWMSAWHRTESGMELQVRRIGLDSQEIEMRVIATSAEPLPTDVPQMALAGSMLVFAWSELGNPGRLYSAMLPLW